jgi:zinc transporter 2
MNVRAAYLHVLGDMLMSIGVVFAAVLIFVWPQLWFADPMCTYLFSVIVLCTTLPLFNSCLRVIMEGAPENVDTLQLEKDIWGVPGVIDIHDLHVWSISSNQPAMTVHLVSQEPSSVLTAVTELCRTKHGIQHTVIQIEDSAHN